MNTSEEQKHYERVYQQAVAIMEQEWLDAGKTREELNQEKPLIALFGRLLASGHSEDEIEAEWAGKTDAEILRAYAPPVLMEKSA